MKKIIKNIFSVMLAAVAGFGFVACDDDLAQAPIVMPAPEIGDGTWQNPLQAWQAHLGTTVNGRTSNWVCGYIVGYVNTDDGNKVVIGSAGAVQSNMVIAQYPYDEEEWAEKGYTLDDCVSVQLPSGTATRTSLNLADNPGNLNKLVSLRGTTGSKYCGIYGVRAANDFNFGAIGRYEPPMDEIHGEYFCNFSASRDINFYLERGWAAYMIKGGLTGWYYKENGGTSFMTISAYYGTATGGPYENWLVSPSFNLDEAKEKTLSFSTQASTLADTSLEVYVMKSQNPQAFEEPVKLDCVIAEAPASGYSSWVSSGTIDLSEFSGTS
ncbi:MAG: choice-of-anchor J domain-containing protein [Muribaculaceae bacterium]|nr:choice-of-anchor J domain-containing protein [Muribaculaceae bacterium]